MQLLSEIFLLFPFLRNRILVISALGALVPPNKWGAKKTEILTKCLMTTCKGKFNFYLK